MAPYLSCDQSLSLHHCEGARCLLHYLYVPETAESDLILSSVWVNRMTGRLLETRVMTLRVDYWCSRHSVYMERIRPPSRLLADQSVVTSLAWPGRNRGTLEKPQWRLGFSVIEDHEIVSFTPHARAGSVALKPFTRG